MSEFFCIKHLSDPQVCCSPPGTWRIDIPEIPKEVNYSGPPQATISRMDTDGVGEVLGYILLSANPKCAETLKEIVRLANEHKKVAL